MTEADIRLAIARSRDKNNKEPLQDGAMSAEVADVIRHALLVNEVARMLMLEELRYGQIDVAEFKRRALNNDPRGRKR